MVQFMKSRTLGFQLILGHQRRVLEPGFDNRHRRSAFHNAVVVFAVDDVEFAIAVGGNGRFKLPRHKRLIIAANHDEHRGVNGR